jgi:hypothetical protein
VADKLLKGLLSREKPGLNLSRKLSKRIGSYSAVCRREINLSVMVSDRRVAVPDMDAATSDAGMSQDDSRSLGMETRLWFVNTNHFRYNFDDNAVNHVATNCPASPALTSRPIVVKLLSSSESPLGTCLNNQRVIIGNAISFRSISMSGKTPDPC